jgi:hypothetical protein
MFRIFVAVIVVALVAAPAILIASRSRLAPGLRLLLSALAFIAPVVLVWAIHLVPAFNGEAPQNAGLWRSVGVLLSVASLIVPWLIYAAVRDRPRAGDA